MKTHTLEGKCPCCGKPLEPFDHYFHSQTGTLILYGNVIKLTPTESFMFKVLVEAFPRTVSFEEMSNKLIASRAEGGMTTLAQTVVMSHLRRKLEVHGWTVSKYSYLLLKYEAK